MSQYHIDRTRAAEHAPPLLDDGFSPPLKHGEPAQPQDPVEGASLEDALASKSDF